ncbi:aminotransferase class I/II-fold pyridoxal phosphate-dependent enzyme [Pseudoalteromonas sp. SCSIO 43201]|uniref:aminotransferase class I/II-fold pyridoxal phosphate-dependent enzyme n=1 Tax=Pseudoalteromonas sp. SCSIO 43201 TaxID=2822842 RepID=UPI002074B567|nr:aminotransferase class I/II-fold pyridoxal phosphate-dependent enzyme [Pseudoalteromonas sp. SCSIO 43201]USD27397.1 aminotransferase class I/II-fold pyridoxal phosphate-dependent enzyme [Pseudoalteromonas sp. SCSIO 43201]
MELVLPDHIKFGQSLTAPVDINLSDSCAQGVALNTLVELAGEAWFERELSYSPMAGSDMLRAAIKAYHLQPQVVLSQEQIVTFSGAQEAIFTVMAQLLSPQDEVLVFTPSYPSLAKLPTQFDAVVKSIPLQANNQWQFDIERLKREANTKTKLIIINAPHNPTGATLSDKDVEEIKRLAQHFDAYILSDEVSAQRADDARIASGRFADYAKSITLGVLSKSLGLPGVRVGWAICGNKALADLLLAGKSYLSICGSQVDDMLASTALNHSDIILKENAKIMARNEAAMCEFVRQHSHKVSWVAPQGGVLSLLQIHSVNDAKSWSRQFAEATSTLLLPANLFVMNSECHFRLGTGKQSFIEGLTRLESYLQ